MGESSESPLVARAADTLDDDVPTDPFPPIVPAIPPEARVRVFGSRAFFRLWLAQVVSSLGDWLGFVAIVALAQRIGGSSPEAAIALVMSARIIPGFFLSQFAGVLVDRWDRKKVMVCCDIGRGLVLATLPFIHTVWGLVLASLLLEICTLLWAPAKEASVPNLVPPDQLTTANSLSLVAAYGTFPIAQLRVRDAHRGRRWPQSGARLRLPRRQPGDARVRRRRLHVLPLRVHDRHAPADEAERDPLDDGKIGFGSVVHELKEGWHFIFLNPMVRAVIIALGTGLIGGGMVVPLGPVFADEVLDSGATGFGLLLTALGSGMAIGVVLLSAFQKKLPKVTIFTASVLGAGVTLIVGASMSTLAPAFLAILGHGCLHRVGVRPRLHDPPRDRRRRPARSHVQRAVHARAVLPAARVRARPVARRRARPLLGRVRSAAQSRSLGLTVSLPGVRLTLWLAGAIIVAAGLLAIHSLRSASTTGRTRDL